MLRNYFLTGLRNLWRDRLYTFINLIGLGIGLGCAFALLLNVQFEHSFDNFHHQPEEIYTIMDEQNSASGTKQIGVVPGPMAPEVSSKLAGIKAWSRHSGQYRTFKVEDRDILDQRGALVDPGFLDVFNFPEIRGNARKALADPKSLVLTEKAAMKYFGSTDVIGKTILMDGRTPMQVAAVIQDVPANSLFTFDYLIPFRLLEDDQNQAGWVRNWNSNSFQTYVRLQPGTNTATLSQQIDKIAHEHQNEQFSAIHYYVRPFSDLHFGKDLYAVGGRTGNSMVTYGMAAVAIFLLLIASINYINMATARAGRRAREVGVRKVLGAHRGQLLAQFLGEAILVIGGATLLALVVLRALIPWFNGVMGSGLKIGMLLEPTALLGLTILLVLLVAITGAYPALYLSRFKPVVTLKGERNLGTGHARLRKGLVVSQFAITAMLAVFFYTVYAQLQHMIQLDKGYDASTLVYFYMSSDRPIQHDQLRHELMTHPSVEAVSLSNNPVANNGNTTFMWAEGASKEQRVEVEWWQGDPYLLSTLKVKPLAGRDLDPSRASDTTNSLVVNEAFARSMGWSPEEAIGKRIAGWAWDDSSAEKGVIIGVIPNIQMRKARYSVMPLMIVGTNMNRDFFAANIRIRADKATEAKAHIEAVMKRLVPTTPIQTEFVSEQFERFYRAETRFTQIMGAFALVSMLLSGFGILGLSAYTARQRRKEMSIRKVLGATRADILGLLASDFMKLVLLANVLAWGGAWYLSELWLADFANRVSFPWLALGMSLTATLLVTLIIIVGNAWSTANSNPSEALRSE